MAIRLELKHTCGRCDGSGIEPATESDVCTSCIGEGELYWGHADALMDEIDAIDDKLIDLETKIDDVMDKCNDIKAVVDLL